MNIYLGGIILVLNDYDLSMFKEFNIDFNPYDDMVFEIKCKMYPVHSLRCIDVEILILPKSFKKCMPMIDKKYNVYSKVKQSRMAEKVWFKNKYDRQSLHYIFK